MLVAKPVQKHLHNQPQPVHHPVPAPAVQHFNQLWIKY
jgi:hypothetical protein